MKKLKKLLDSLPGWAFVIALFSPIAMLIEYNIGFPSMTNALKAVAAYIVGVSLYGLGMLLIFMTFDLINKWLRS